MLPDLIAATRQHCARVRVFAAALALALLLAQWAGWWHQAHHIQTPALVAQAVHAAVVDSAVGDVVHHDAGSRLCVWLDHLLLAPAAPATATAWDAPCAHPPLPATAPVARRGQAPAAAYAARAPPSLV